MQSGLLLGIRILDQFDNRILDEFLDLGDLDEIVDSFALVFEMKARVLEGSRHFSNRLADIVDSLLTRNLS